MRQTHVAGEKLLVDYAGPTVPLIDPFSGEITRAHIFVAVWGASNYTYAEATAAESKADWIAAHVNALTFFGGAPRAPGARQSSGSDPRPGPLRANCQPDL